MPAKRTPDPALIEAVLSASRVVVAVATRALAGVAPDVTLPQFRTLVLLDQYGTITVRELADSLDTAPSTATRMCDRLVAKGLMSRGPDPHDRRQVLLSVTAAGRSLVAASTERRRAEFERLLSAVPKRRQAEITRALTIFIEAAGREELAPVSLRPGSAGNALGDRVARTSYLQRWVGLRSRDRPDRRPRCDHVLLGPDRSDAPVARFPRLDTTRPARTVKGADSTTVRISSARGPFR